jgi:hypothetical protein
MLSMTTLALRLLSFKSEWNFLFAIVSGDLVSDVVQSSLDEPQGDREGGFVPVQLRAETI